MFYGNKGCHGSSKHFLIVRKSAHSGKRHGEMFMYGTGELRSHGEHKWDLAQYRWGDIDLKLELWGRTQEVTFHLDQDNWVPFEVHRWGEREHKVKGTSWTRCRVSLKDQSPTQHFQITIDNLYWVTIVNYYHFPWIIWLSFLSEVWKEIPALNLLYRWGNRVTDHKDAHSRPHSSNVKHWILCSQPV